MVRGSLFIVTCNWLLVIDLRGSANLSLQRTNLCCLSTFSIIQDKGRFSSRKRHFLEFLAAKRPKRLAVNDLGQKKILSGYFIQLLRYAAPPDARSTTVRLRSVETARVVLE